MSSKTQRLILPIIVFSQFCCTSLWFAGNGVMGALITNFDLSPDALGHLTSAVQMGFIMGTLTFALLTVADRFSPAKVFLLCALLGALANVAIILPSNTFYTLFLWRLATGFFLAGIYPIGMKIASDHFEKGLGKSLGFLVGALVLGKSFPHLLNFLNTYFSWQYVILTTSLSSSLGGLLMIFLVPNGPYQRRGQKLALSASFKVFKTPGMRSAAFGYFGHMWELYAFWSFVPIFLGTYLQLHPEKNLGISLFTFITIALGAFACVIGGYMSLTFGTKRVATIALAGSGICCLLSPLMLQTTQTFVLLLFLFSWGMLVIADSPLFSTLVAQNAIPELKGSALTLVNCIGFSITIVSIQLLTWLSGIIDPTFIFVFLGLGPAFGLWSLVRNNPEELRPVMQ